jgi:hypothetical protein
MITINLVPYCFFLYDNDDQRTLTMALKQVLKTQKH